MRCLRPGKIGIGMRADPGQKRHAAQHDEAVDLELVLVTEWPDTAIALCPGGAERRHLRVVFHEADTGSEVIHEPAETAVIEIDQPCLVIVDQEVGEAHVGVDQAVAFR